MEYNFNNEVKLFMIFDILGDTQRSGPLDWKIERERLEDVKDHILDLLLIFRIIKKHLPQDLDHDKINDYIICHDLPEAITGDITKFEGVPESEIKRVTEIAIKYLSDKLNEVIDFSNILNNYETRVDIESKVVHMIDKLHSSTTFIKYQSEQNVNMDDPRISKELRNHPFVVEKIAEGKDLADIFFEFHMKAINITDEECEKYNIKRQQADTIVNVIKAFANEIYNQKLNGTLLDTDKDFPEEAMIYNRKKRKTSKTEIIYDKLVRDNIPQIIINNGAKPIYRELNDEEYWCYLLKKDEEELQEVKEASSKEEIKKELADKLEIIKAMAEFHGFDLQDIIEEADRKKAKNGGFQKRILLEKVTEN